MGLYGQEGNDVVIDDVLTLVEASRRWRIPPSTLRHYISGYRRADGTQVAPRFGAGEARKSAGTILVTAAAMRRVCGAPPAKPRYVQTALFDERQ